VVQNRTNMQHNQEHQHGSDDTMQHARYENLKECLLLEKIAPLYAGLPISIFLDNANFPNEANGAKKFALHLPLRAVQGFAQFA
jgi:hypothetical protein